MKTSVPSALLIILAGIWLLLQTVGGDLPRRLLTLSRFSDDVRWSDPTGVKGGGMSTGNGDADGGGEFGAR